MDLEFTDILLVGLCLEFEPHMLDQYIGQDIMASLLNQKLDLPDLRITMDLTDEREVEKWERWLLQNLSPHRIQYFDPDLD